MKPGFSSTGNVYTSHTLNVNGIGAAAIIHQDGQSPTLGSWQAGTGRVLELVYNDGFFVIVSAPQYYQTYTPTLTPSAGSAASVVWNHASFTRLNSSILLNINVNWTQNTASAAYIDITLPVRAAYQGSMMPGTITPGGTTYTAFGLTYIGTPGYVRFYDYIQSSILTGAKSLTLSGHYQIG